MNDEVKPDRPRSQPSLEQRKRLLIAQGAMYRLGVFESRHQLVSGIRVDQIARSALSHVLASRFPLVDSLLSFRGLKSLRGLHFAGLKLAVPLVLPLLTRGFGLLSRRSWLVRPVLLGSASLAGAVGAGLLVYRWRKKQQQKSGAGFRTSRSRGRG